MTQPDSPEGDLAEILWDMKDRLDMRPAMDEEIIESTLAQIQEYYTNKFLEHEHNFNKAYGFCRGCGRSWQSIEVSKSAIKQLGKRGE